MLSKTSFWPALVSLVLAGCGSDSLDQADDVRFWATTASALAVYSHAHGPFAFADGEGPFADPACPAASDDGTTVTITGGCTDTEGVEWTGSATIVSSGDTRTLTFDDYGSFSDPDQRATLSGDVALTEVEPGVHTFEAGFVHEGGMTTTYRYSGRVEGGYDGPTTWNGTGTIEREGLVRPTGTIEAITVDEVADDTVCTGQPASGQTTLVMGDQEAVVIYDGATDCDQDKAARWTLDGEDMGLLTGINCTAVPGASGRGATAALALFGVAGLALTRRRARR